MSEVNMNEGVKDETRVEQVIENAQAAFDGSISTVAQGAALRTVFNVSRFGRLRSTEGVVDKDEYDKIHGALKDILSAVALKSYELGFNDGIKEQGE